MDALWRDMKRKIDSLLFYNHFSLNDGFVSPSLYWTLLFQLDLLEAIPVLLDDGFMDHVIASQLQELFPFLRFKR